MLHRFRLVISYLYRFFINVTIVTTFFEILFTHNFIQKNDQLEKVGRLSQNRKILTNDTFSNNQVYHLGDYPPHAYLVSLSFDLL